MALRLCALAAALAATPAFAQTVPQQLLLGVSGPNDASGALLAVEGAGFCLRTLYTGCNVPFRGVAVDPARQNAYAASPANIYRLPLTNATVTGPTCGTALLPAPTGSQARNLQSVAVDESNVYFLDNSQTIYKLPVAGPFPAIPSALVADGIDGVSGERLGLALSRDRLYYSVNGVNASNSQQTIRGIYSIDKITGTDAHWFFLYGSNQAWWPTELAMFPSLSSLVSAEYRSEGNMNLKRNAIGTAGPQITLNTFVAQTATLHLAADDGSAVVWYQAPTANILSAQNATARNEEPFLSGILDLTAAVPASVGSIRGIAVAPALNRGSEFVYPRETPQGGLPVATCTPSPTPNPSPNGAGGATPFGSPLALAVLLAALVASAMISLAA